MLKGEVKINYEILGTTAEKAWKYYEALGKIKDAMTKARTELDYADKPESLKALNAISEKLDTQIQGCSEELKDLLELLSGYVREMEGIMPAANSSKNILVDKNDIYWNIKSVKTACDSLSLVRNEIVILPSSGLGKTAQEKELMKKNYQAIEDARILICK